MEQLSLKRSVGYDDPTAHALDNRDIIVAAAMPGAILSTAKVRVICAASAM